MMSAGREKSAFSIVGSIDRGSFSADHGHLPDRSCPQQFKSVPEISKTRAHRGRLLLVTHVYGTNTGIAAVARGEHGHNEAGLHYAALRYFTLEGARAVAVQLANATFAARQRVIWGDSTTTVASDSTHFRAYDQNLFTPGTPA
jgi:Tn3 transposase DDE domain